MKHFLTVNIDVHTLVLKLFPYTHKRKSWTSAECQGSVLIHFFFLNYHMYMCVHSGVFCLIFFFPSLF